jgi:hypothetical protein
VRVCGRVEQGLVEERFGEASIVEHEHATEGKMSRHLMVGLSESGELNQCPVPTNLGKRISHTFL